MIKRPKYFAFAAIMQKQARGQLHGFMLYANNRLKIVCMYLRIALDGYQRR